MEIQLYKRKRQNLNGDQNPKKMKNKHVLYILFIVIPILSFYSCMTSTKFVSSSYKHLVNNIENQESLYFQGQIKKSIRLRDTLILECQYSNDIEKLIKIVPCDSCYENGSCGIFFDFNYLEKLRKYIQKRDKKTEIEFISKEYYDSLAVKSVEEYLKDEH